jgi:subfamily B ATP-binding cassette protein MsbA
MTLPPRRIWDLLWPYIKQDRWYLVVALFCAAGVAATDGTVASLLKPFIDSANKAAVSKVDTVELHRLNLVSLAIIGVYVLRWFLTYGDMVFFSEAGQRLGLRLRNRIYEHLQGLSLNFFNRQRTGALMSTMNNDVPLLQQSISGLKDLAPAPFYVIGGVIYIFLISVKLSLIALVAFPLMAYSISLLTRRIRRSTGETQNKLADLNTLMEETLSGIRIIQSFGAETQTVARFRQENRAAKDFSMVVVRQSARIKPTNDLIGAFGIAFALWVAGHMVADNELTLGAVGTFVFTLNLIAKGVGGLGGAKVTWEQIQAGSSRIFQNVLDVRSEIQDAPDAIALPEVAGRVEFDHVAFAYNPDTPVLRDISFTMDPGEVVAVVGSSGAGKSTIADLIPRFYDPQAGVIRVDGHDLRHVTLASLRRQIAIVPQETILFGGTIRDNIAYGNPKATDAMIEAAARAANAHSFITNPAIMPDGYDTLVGERGKQVSGGQRQRIAIARALLKDPRILILDEATSALDAESEKVVQEALETLMRGRTTLVIAHRLSTIQNAHKILVMEAGRIVESGTHNDLMRRRGGLYRHLYERFHEMKFPWNEAAEGEAGEGEAGEGEAGEDEERLDPSPPAAAALKA